jgi:peptide deformylase
MSHNLVYYGNETLASVADRVDNIDGEIISIINDMFDVMYKEKGIGLAGPQIDLKKRIIVIDTGDEKNGRIALVNPEIKEFSTGLEPYEEGCLSLPGLLADVIRPAEVLVKGVTPDGREVEFEASGLLARVMQHEIDHLDGIVFIDRIEKYIRDEFRAELKRIKKLNKK